MKQLLWIVAVSSLCYFSCKKNTNPATAVNYKDTFQVHFTMDNLQYDRVLAHNDPGIGVGSDYSTLNGYVYFASGPSFGFADRSNFSFMVGSGYGPLNTNYDSAFESFKKQFAPGSKEFDSISFAPPSGEDRIEIRFIDKDDYEWCSTKHTITGPFTIAKSVNQPGSSFIISEMTPVSIVGNKINAVDIKGTFNCILYKTDSLNKLSSEKKIITNGRFTALVGL